MTITGLVHVDVNCSDVDRSRAFYEMLGFEHMADVPPTNTTEVAVSPRYRPDRAGDRRSGRRHGPAPSGR